MKYIVTQTQRNNIIEKLIRSTIPVIDIEFKEMKTMSVKDGKTKRRISTWISITVDPNKVPSHNSRYFYVEKIINEQLIKYLNIDTFEFMSPYTIYVKPMSTKEVNI
jgi:hypothetical protein